MPNIDQINVFFPRVLIIALGRINENDPFNNGMLIRNLFSFWPRDRIAQIYSSGNNKDVGFCGRYYKIGCAERRFGRFFYRLKKETMEPETENNGFQVESKTIAGLAMRKNNILRNIFIDSGIYELIFKPRLSWEMMSWIKDFNPDVILAQGYNLTFTWLPLMISRETRIPIAFFCSDDWPSYLYAKPSLGSEFIHRIVVCSAKKLIYSAKVVFAFGERMAEEYSKRYGKKCVVILHSDQPARFENAPLKRVYNRNIKSILALGSFNEFRWPMLIDLNECCKKLNSEGLVVRASVMALFIDPKGKKELEKLEYIDVLPDPGNDELPSYLKGADLLMLIEAFDEKYVKDIELSVSSKSHLFMFSKRPIIVYGSGRSGVSLYAQKMGWAKAVTTRNVEQLEKAIRELLSNDLLADKITEQAYAVALSQHSRAIINERFRMALMKIRTAFPLTQENDEREKSR